MKSLSDKAGFLIIANLFKYAVAFVMPMILVRLLSQSEYGTYQQLTLVATTAIGLMVLGLPTSVFYFYHQSNGLRAPALVIQTTLMLGAAGIIGTSIIYLGATYISEALNNSSMANLLSIFALSIAFLVASEHCISILIAQNKYRTAVTFELGETVARLLTLLLPLWLGYGLEGLVIGVLLFSVLRFAIRITYMVTKSGLDFAGWRIHTFVKDQVAYSLPLALTSLAALIGNTFNKALVAASFTPAQFAIYSVGNLPIPLASIFQASVVNVLRGSLPPIVSAGNKIEVARILREATRGLSLIVLPSFVFLFGFSHELITLLFTSKYEESVQIFRIILWEVPLDMMVLSPIPQIFGRTQANLYINLTVTATLLALSYILLKSVGFYGAAIALVASQYLGSALFLMFAMRLTNATIGQLVPVRHICLTLLASFIGLVCARQALGAYGSPLVDFLLAAIIFGIVFIAVAMVIGPISGDDRKLLARWLRKLIPTKGC